MMMKNNITVVERDGVIFTLTPYNANFVATAKKIGGKWNAGEKAWMFPVTSREELAQLLKDIFGYEADASNTSSLDEEEHKRLAAAIQECVALLSLEDKKTLLKNLKSKIDHTYMPQIYRPD